MLTCLGGDSEASSRGAVGRVHARADGYGAAAYGGDGWTDDDDDDEYQARVYAVGREGRDC